ncbi:unnamed protein product [Lactuca saligna]|uniref:Gamma-glutamylcyclotransferase n=1 Tax=Lactuca saligna TaxID=75948 RepID=A0AA35YRX7_LACSI|nr:unnamed protein product [Lactuca saligna]
MARQITTAIGLCGNNRDYIFLMEKDMFDIGHEDDMVIELENAVRKVKKTNVSPEPESFSYEDGVLELVEASDNLKHKGLGIKDHLRKIAGVHFQATKTSFSDSEREESELEDDHSFKKIDELSESKVKIKKLCRKLLSQVPEKSMKLKKTQGSNHFQVMFTSNLHIQTPADVL